MLLDDTQESCNTLQRSTGRMVLCECATNDSFIVCHVAHVRAWEGVRVSQRSDELHSTCDGVACFNRMHCARAFASQPFPVATCILMKCTRTRQVVYWERESVSICARRYHRQEESVVVASILLTWDFLFFLLSTIFLFDSL